MHREIMLRRKHNARFADSLLESVTNSLDLPILAFEKSLAIGPRLTCVICDRMVVVSLGTGPGLVCDRLHEMCSMMSFAGGGDGCIRKTMYKMILADCWGIVVVKSV